MKHLPAAPNARDGSRGDLRIEVGWVELGTDHRAAARARAFVRASLAARDVPVALIDDAVLLTSELVGNAYRHGRGDAAVRVSLRPGRVRIEVRDDDARAPVLATPVTPDAEGGRGLHLVDLLATSWGWQPVGTGKDVWFELPCE